ncbi:hypothetical protein AYO40_01015 [Planctomycetaceae bacterium SCGC AG-212-D15]|nr:hypothetical protein AYO40_01015 [Planctomycetaceae bacterium SCGC AG-212-D15]
MQNGDLKELLGYASAIVPLVAAVCGGTWYGVRKLNQFASTRPLFSPSVLIIAALTLVCFGFQQAGEGPSAPRQTFNQQQLSKLASDPSVDADKLKLSVEYAKELDSRETTSASVVREPILPPSASVPAVGGSLALLVLSLLFFARRLVNKRQEA